MYAILRSSTKQNYPIKMTFTVRKLMSINLMSNMNMQKRYGCLISNQSENIMIYILDQMFSYHQMCSKTLEIYVCNITS